MAPELDVTEWLNGEPAPLSSLRGKVVMVEAFQMLCPGCVSHGIPQAQKVHQMTDPDQLAVVGLHTVFEHHSVMGRDALEVFISEYRLGFPVGIDRHIPDDPIPVTMRRYRLQGTPSILLIDRQGRLRYSGFGSGEDLNLGMTLGQLLAEDDNTN